MGNFIVQDQWENQEQDGSKSRGTHHRSVEYKGGGDKQKTEKNGGVFCGRSGCRRCCSTTDGMDWILKSVIFHRVQEGI